MYEINKAAVIGAGTMGLGIAGQLANAGVDVLLLDIPAAGDKRNAHAERAKASSFITTRRIFPVA